MRPEQASGAPPHAPLGLGALTPGRGGLLSRDGLLIPDLPDLVLVPATGQDSAATQSQL